MLFTSSCFNPGQQLGFYPCSRPCPTDVPVGRQTVSRLILVGSQSERCDLPGSASEDASGSKPWQEMRAQTPRIMKHERKHQGAFANNVNNAAATPGSAAPAQPDDIMPTTETIFSNPPAPRQPETPEEESFRRFLKTHLPRHKASPALIQRIRSHIQEDRQL